ncbi:hypothetical protein M8J76_011187 [Diaphorina citri]|nr:hypothetical protein M8J76_011187 [Diaphorina citri]
MASAWKVLLSVALYQTCLSYVESLDCQFPPIDRAALGKDVLGDAEKTKICSLPRPHTLCTTAGPADAECRAIAASVGATADITCVNKNVCGFLVDKPIRPATYASGPAIPAHATALTLTERPAYTLFKTSMASTWFILMSVALTQLCLSYIPTQAATDCEFPAIDRASLTKDVLGDLEKNHVCGLSRPEKLCERVGKADKPCKAIARAVGGVANVTCSHQNTCGFLVRRPVQHPSQPGYAYVSLCKPEFIGVIFPCIENKLIIADPTFRNLED